ncbi:MAG: efflux RND transporter permease subunit [bacterium]|nr:MAG: efflux RND transporter permease subunit [bacterium]
MKKLTQFSVNYPITILMLVLAVILLGYISFSKLGIDLFPDLNNPRIFVELKVGERPPEEIEKQFVESIESLAIRQKKVIQVSSITRVGSAQIAVEYSWNVDMDEAFLDLQKMLTTFSQNSEIDELTITQHDPNAAPVLLLGLSHPQIEDMDELRRIAENYLRNELIRLEGIAEVELLGQEEKEVVIETNNYLLEAYNLSPSAVAARIRNYNRNASGGSIVEMGRKYIIKGVGEFQSIDEIGNVIVTYAQPTSLTTGVQTSITTERVPVYLRDVAKLSFKNKEPENIVRINQQRCMGLAIYKETKFNTVKAVDDLLEALGNLRKALPGYELTIIQNQGEFITTAVDEVKQTALIGIILAVIVLYIFLRRVGVTAIISVAIPISVVATFNLMYFNGLSLNIMTLGGLALGAGMLVDNAIVVMENIFRNLESGMSLREASIDGTAQVGGAITASTITTIIVFLPIVYLHGSAGELFKEQAWTVAFSLLSSLVVAILVIPMLSTRLLKTQPDKPLHKSIRFKKYGDFLNHILDKRWAVIGGAVVLVVIAVLLIPIVGSEFVPKTDLNEFSIELKLPEGTELYRTERTVDNIEQIINAILKDELKTTYSKIGPSVELSSGESSIFEDENTATMKVILNQDHKISSDEFISRLSKALADIPDIEMQFIQEQTALQTTLGTESAPIAVEVKGEDLQILQQLTEQVKQKIQPMKELFNLETSFDEGRPEVDVVLDRVKAGIYNVSIDNISSQLQDQLIGRNAGQWENEGELQDITIKLPYLSVNQIEDITIESGDQKIRLDELARIRKSNAPKEINRRNQARIGKVTAHLQTDRPFDHVVRQIEQKIDEIDFPPEYQYQITGEEQKRKDAFQNLKFALILSIILVYMVMASQFESLIHPFTILLTIPLAGVGAILIFFILGKSLNIMAYIGIIMLAGIAVNDSIILVDAINQLKREGLSRKEAIIEAGQRRIRPIIMTSLTTILALLPLTFGFGEGAALRSPMALAVIGGLITSTLLTLVVIPCVYLVLDQVRK